MFHLQRNNAPQFQMNEDAAFGMADVLSEYATALQGIFLDAAGIIGVRADKRQSKIRHHGQILTLDAFLSIFKCYHVYPVGKLPVILQLSTSFNTEIGFAFSTSINRHF